MFVGDILTMNAERFPSKAALITEEGTVTYQRLETSANRIAHVLLNCGVEPGERVAFIEKTCAGCIETTSAIVKTGAIMVSINNLYLSHEVSTVLRNCDPAFLVFGEEQDGLVRGIQKDFPGIRHYFCTGPSDWAPDLTAEAKDAPDDRPEIRASVDDVFIIIYTGGTTGEPKGATYTHRAFWSNLLATIIDTYQQVHDDIWIGPVPMYHIGGYGTLMRILVMGNTFVLKEKFNPSDYLSTIEREKVTVLYAYPTMINAMINAQDARRYDLSSLRLVIYGGSPIPKATLEKAHSLFQCDFLQRYGATECCGSAISVLSPEQHRLALTRGEQYRNRLQSAGKPSLGTKIRLLDENGSVIGEPGKAGALEARLDAPMEGYWGEPEETAKVLKDGWLRLGDIAERDEDGFYYLVDREKDMIISGARNIYPREVEEVLYAHPAVEEASVIGVPDDYWGEAVKAVVVLRNGMIATEEELIDHCREHLAGYKKPKSVDFVGALPKNPGGKILKRELRKRYWKDSEKLVH